MSKQTKEVIGIIKLNVAAGKANPAPPVGPALGQKGLNIMDFCKKFNDATKSLETGTPVPVEITAYKDKSFTFITKTPPASYFLKKYAKIPKGSSSTKKVDHVGQISYDQCLEIAKIKLEDMNAHDIDSAARMICGTAESIGLNVVGRK